MHGPGLALSSSSVPEGVGECRVGTDVGFLFSRVSLSRLLLFGHHLVSRLLGSHLHRTYLLDGLILSYFSGLVVWWCLLCLSLYPLSPVAWLSEDPRAGLPAPSAQGRLYFPCPVPVILQGVCALPHSPPSLTACGLGRGATPTFPFQCKCSWVRNVTRQKARASGSPHAGSCLCLTCPLGLCLVLRKAVGIKQAARV